MRASPSIVPGVCLAPGTTQAEVVEDQIDIPVDADAVVWAKQLLDGNDIELWSGDRFVSRLNHKPEAAASIGRYFSTSSS